MRCTIFSNGATPAQLPRSAGSILETSGLADPAPILLALGADRQLATRFHLAGVTTLVDAVNGLSSLARHREAERQAALADRIGIAKSDLLPAAERAARLADLRGGLRALNPVAPILDVAAGELGPEAFLDEPLALRPLEGARATGHSPSVTSYVFESETFASAPALAHFLDLLRDLLGPRLLRVKGLIGLADDPARPLLIHGAQHVFHPPRRLAGLAGRRASHEAGRHRRGRLAQRDCPAVGGAGGRAADRRPRPGGARREPPGAPARRSAGLIRAIR